MVNRFDRSMSPSSVRAETPEIQSSRFKHVKEGRLSSLQSKVMRFIESKKKLLESSTKSRAFVNFAMKKNITQSGASAPRSDGLRSKYQGYGTAVKLAAACEEIDRFLNSSECSESEKNALREVKKGRELMRDIWSAPKDNRGAKVAALVQTLQDPNSTKPVNLQSGGKSILIPVETSDPKGSHYITCEVKREVRNGKDSTFFCIHNRGSGAEHPLHGNLLVKDENGYDYKETSIEIEVNDPSVLTEEFFSKLMASDPSLGLTAPYQLVEDSIIKKGLGAKVVPREIKEVGIEFDKNFPGYNQFFELFSQPPKLSELKFDGSFQDKSIIDSISKRLIESLQNPLINQFPELGKLINTLINSLKSGDKQSIEQAKNNLNAFIKDNIQSKGTELQRRLIKEGAVHSLQKYGTCSISNMTQPEKGILDPITVRKLKLFGIQRRIADVIQDSTIHPKEKNVMIDVANARIDKLERDINRMSQQMAIHNGNGLEAHYDIQARNLQRMAPNRVGNLLNVGRELTSRMLAHSQAKMKSPVRDAEQYFADRNKHQGLLNSPNENDKETARAWFRAYGNQKTVAFYEKIAKDYDNERIRLRADLQKQLGQIRDDLKLQGVDPSLLDEINRVTFEVAKGNTPTDQAVNMCQNLFEKIESSLNPNTPTLY